MTGTTEDGTLGLSETAEGGLGGDGFGGPGGRAGSGSATLDLNDLQNPSQYQSNVIGGAVSALGANGGQGTTDGASGAATADISITGKAQVTTTASAEGGVGTDIGGNATASAASIGVNTNATANAIGGYGADTGGNATASAASSGTDTDATAGATGGSGTTHDGTGVATATISGSDGSAASGKISADAESSSVASTAVVYEAYASAIADASVAAGSTDTASAIAQTQIGGAQASFPGASPAVAALDGAPNAAASNAVLTANPAIKSAFGAAPSFFSIGELAGGDPATGVTVQSDTSEVETEIDLGNLSGAGDLEIGLFNGAASTTGVTGVTLSVTNGSTALLPMQTFTSGPDAAAFFIDQAFNLGALATSAISPSISL